MTSPLLVEAKRHGVDLEQPLNLVEQRLSECFEDEEALVTLMVGHLNNAGGKRFRPLLVMLAAMAGGMKADHPDVIDAAVLVEYTHQSTLYHDDLMDGADTRRGVQSAHVKWSATVAVLAGDWLLSQASYLASRLDKRVVPELSRCVMSLTRGQIREVVTSRDAHEHGLESIEPSVDMYLSAIEGKTASLIAGAAAIGSMVAGFDDENVDLMRRFGYHTGMAFQIVDDIIDITTDGSTSGKTRGTDLREGVLTLPVLLALKSDGAESPLHDYLKSPTEDNIESALNYLNTHKSIEEAKDIAFEHIDQAGVVLGSVSGADDHIIDALMGLSSQAVNRIS